MNNSAKVSRLKESNVFFQESAHILDTKKLYNYGANKGIDVNGLKLRICFFSFTRSHVSVLDLCKTFKRHSELCELVIVSEIYNSRYVCTWVCADNSKNQILRVPNKMQVSIF